MSAEPPTRKDIYNEIDRMKELADISENMWKLELEDLEAKNIGFDYYINSNEQVCSGALSYFPYHSFFIPLAKSLTLEFGVEENECPSGEWPLHDANICTAEAIEACFDIQNRTIGVFSPSSASCVSELLRQDEIVGKVVLLKLLRHALSYLQNDLRLAGAILEQLAQHRLLDDPSFFRYFIVLIHQSYPEFSVQCRGHCYEDPHEAGYESENDVDHSCIWFTYFISKLESAIGSISLLTEDHVILFSAWVQLECDVVSPSAAEWDDLLFGSCGNSTVDPLNSTSSSEKTIKMKKISTMVRRTMHIGNLESERTCYPYKVKMLSSIIIGLNNQITSNSLVPIDKLDEPPAKYHSSSVKLLSFIGECILRRLPDTDATNDIGSELMNAFTSLYISKHRMNQRIRNFFDPEKYSQAISNAADYQKEKIEVPEHVLDILRGLYLRDIIYTDVGTLPDNESGSIYGFGDWLVQTRQPISPYDILVMDHDQNYATESPTIFRDIDDISLDDDHKRARYDFMILNMVRAWKQPWSEKSHLSFSRQFRDAAYTLALCSRRFFMPPDIVDHILTFMSRLWWDDDTKRCFCRDCNISDISLKIENRITSRENEQETLSDTITNKNNRTYILCDHCEVVSFCSLKCKTKAMHEGHRKRCRFPPYKCGKEEIDLCNKILDNEDPVILVDEDNRIEDCNDDSSWESVQSDDNENQINPTSDSKLILNFFASRTYKYLRSEALPFAAYYNDSDDE